MEKRKKESQKVTPRGAENVTEEEVASSQSQVVEQEEEDGLSASYWRMMKDFQKDPGSLDVWRKRQLRKAALRDLRKDRSRSPR